MPYFRQKIGMIILVGVLVAALSFAVLVIKEKKYKVATDFLIVRNQTGNQDYYSLTKSAEYLGKVLSESIYSDLFIGEVIKTGKVGEEFLSFDKRARVRGWNEIISVKRGPELGIFSVEVIGDNQKEAVRISQAIADVLVNSNKIFLGENQNVEIKMLTGPITENNPGLETIALVLAGGMILGVLFGFVWVYFRNEINFQPEIVDEYEESLRFLDKE